MRTMILRRFNPIDVTDLGNRAGWNVAAMVALSLIGACVTGLLAQLRVPIPGTPVPVTGQVLAVLVFGTVLGSGYGALSQVLYIGMGLMGMPWFTGWKSGMVVLAGPTGGYLVGFMVAALFLGTVSERGPGARTIGGQLARMLAAVGLIWFFGVSHMLLLGCDISTAIMWGLVPFIAADVLKAMMAASFTSVVLSKRARS